MLSLGKREIMNEVVDFVCEKYPMLPREDVEKFLSKNKDKVYTIRDEQVIKCVSFYYKLTDDSFDKVKSEKIDLRVADNHVALQKENGRNYHFIMLATKGARIILQGLKDIIRRDRPKTVSWFSPDMNQFFIKKVGD